MEELLETAAQSPYGIRVQVNDPQTFKVEFEKARDEYIQRGRPYGNLVARLSPSKENEVWLVKSEFLTKSSADSTEAISK